MMLSLAEIL